MMKRMIAMLLAVLMVLSLVGCGEGTAASGNTANLDEELQRASNAGLLPEEWLSSMSEPVTIAEFNGLLTKIVAMRNPDLVPEWESVAAQALQTEDTAQRDDAILSIFEAAMVMGIDATEGNSTEESWEGRTPGIDWWEGRSDDYDYFPNWNTMYDDGDDEDYNMQMHSAWYVERHLSLVSRKYMFEPTEKWTFGFEQTVTKEEAARALLRFMESNMELAELFQEDEASAVVAEAILTKAEERRQAILNSPTEVSYTGTAYYVSNSGNDSNDGKSPETAWATVSRVNEVTLNVGDAVFFERGGTWRVQTLETKKGVTYSAYGEGVKPRLIGSPENGAGEEKWSLLEGTENIWVFYKDMLDCGVIALDDSAAAQKKIGFWNGTQYLEYRGQSASQEELLSAPAFDVKQDLSEDLTFFSEASSKLPTDLPVYLDGAMAHYTDMPLSCKTKGKLYLRCDEGNPGKLYHSIEFVTPLYVFNDPVAEGCTLDNLFIGYGGIGVSVGNAGLTVQNCELAWIGGRIISYSFEDHDGNPRGALRVGGAIGSHADDMTIRNNYIHEIYEEAALVEIFESQKAYTDDLIIKDVLIAENLIYHVGSGLGYFNWDMERNPEMMFKKLIYEDNMVLFTGLNDWLSKITSCAFAVDGGPNLQEGAVVRNNVFFASRDCLFYLNQYHEDTIADYEGNQYIQFSGYPYLLLNEEQRRYYADEAEYAVHELLGDQTGMITTVYSMKWNDLDW